MRRGSGALAGLVVGLVGLLGLGAVLAGCAGLPTAGPVVAGRSVGAEFELPPQVVPRGPFRGESPSSVVRGFLEAAAQERDDRRIAREYLTPSRRSSWRPDVQVVVYPDDARSPQVEVLQGAAYEPSSPSSSSSSASSSSRPGSKAVRAAGRTAAPVPVPPDGTRARVSVTVPAAGRLDEGGVWTAGTGRERRVFDLVARNGQWRIDGLADGLLVSAAEFRSYWTSVALYFADPSGQYLVPDVRYVELGSPSTPTVVVRALLAGPVPWLAPAVRTGAPPGTSMPVEAVPVVGTTATVDLSRQVLAADRVHREMLREQLRATLTQIRSPVPITAVTVTVGGSPLADVASGDGDGGRPVEKVPDFTVDPVPDDTLVGTDLKRKVVQVADPAAGGAAPARGVPAGVELAAPARSADATVWAGLADGGTRLEVWTPSGAAHSALVGADATRPSVDVHGWAWSSPGSSTGKVVALTPGGSNVAVAAPWLAGARVLALRVSREGARALVLYSRGGVTSAVVSGIVRGDGPAAGTPVALTEPAGPLVPGLSSGVDAVWGGDDQQVVVLGARAGEQEQPLVVQIPGQVRGTAPVPRTAQIRWVLSGAGPDATPTLVTADGRLLSRSGAGWAQSSAKDLHVLWATTAG